jgi:hypothetical protein
MQKNQSDGSPVSGNGIIVSSEWLFCIGRVTVLLQDEDVKESVVSPMPPKEKRNDDL